MQIYGNVAKEPKFTLAKTPGSKGSWQTRVGETIGTETTWYTIKDYSPEDQPPAYVVGDFIKVQGALRLGFFMANTGKPSGTLYVNVMTVSVHTSAADRQAQKASEKEPAPKAPVVAPATAAQATEAGKAPVVKAQAKEALAPDVQATAPVIETKAPVVKAPPPVAEYEVDESWLALCD